MKYLILLITILSCTTTPNDPLIDKISTFMISRMDDPSSFEFVSLDRVDTVYYNEYRLAMIKIYEDDSDLFDDDKSLRELDSLRNSTNYPDSSDIMEINVYCKIRGKNNMGALVLNDYTVTLTPDGEISVVK